MMHNMVLMNQEDLIAIHQKIDEIIRVLNAPGPLNNNPITMESFTDALNFLSVLVKYERFDVEACRREIAFLRNLID